MPARWPPSPGPSPGSCPWPPDGRARRGRRSAETLIPISSHRRRRGPGIGAIFDRVMRPRPSPLERSRRRDGHLYGGTQPTDISMINRRCYRLRLFRWLESLPCRHTIQPRRTGRTARPSPPASVRAPPRAGGVRALGRPAHETDRRRGLTIDDRQGGRYLGIPPQSPIAPLPITPAATESGAGPNDATARPVLASS